VLRDRERKRQERAAARRASPSLSLLLTVESEAGEEEDVDPVNRRGLLGVGVGAALGATGVAAAPAARVIDPELPDHCNSLLNLLGRHDHAFGPRDVLVCVRRELRVITEHRQAARGELRVQLMCVEARWAGLAGWLSEDTGDRRSRDAWTARALRLATEADYADMAALALVRQSQWAVDARRAIAYAEDALRVPGVQAQTRAWCARYAAYGYALLNDASTCARRLSDAEAALLDADSPPPPWAGDFRVDAIGSRAAEARCWLTLAPSKAIPLYEQALRDWPRALVRDGGLHQARLALACAATGELDRARVEGRKALAVARATKSSAIERELKRLSRTLAAA